MTTAPETSTETRDVASRDTDMALERSRPTPVLISEQEVLLSTAAARFVAPAMIPRHWWGTALIETIGRIHIALPEPRPCYPRRGAIYFEGARMSREMDHL
jgi:hypothetical protein